MGDARLVAEQLLAALPERPAGDKPFHGAESLTSIAGFDIARDFEVAHTPRTVDPRALGVELDKLLPRDRTVVYDAGNFLGVLPYLTVPTPGHLKMTSEFASIGLRFGTALGVAKGRPETPTVLVIGDGGFLMTMSELETAIREDLPLIIVLMNDCAYGAELHFLAMRKLPVPKSVFADVEVASVAEAFGFQAYTIRTLDELRALGPILSQPDGPILLDCKVNAEIAAPFMGEFAEFEARHQPPTLPLGAGSVAEERGNEREGIGRLREQRSLPSGELHIGRRKHTRPRPGHVGDAVLVEQRPALVVGSPWSRSVHHGLGEQHDRPGRYFRNDHARGVFRGLVNLPRHLEAALVTPGNTPESPVCRSAIGEIPGRDRESLVDPVGGKVKALSRPGEGVRRRRSVVRVHDSHGLALVHADPVEAVQPEAVPEPEAKNGHDHLVIQQATERLPPVEEAMIRSVLSGGRPEADAFARARQPLRVDQSIQLRQLGRAQHVVNHEIALKIEQVLLQLAL